MYPTLSRDPLAEPEDDVPFGIGRDKSRPYERVRGLPADLAGGFDVGNDGFQVFAGQAVIQQVLLHHHHLVLQVHLAPIALHQTRR